MRGIFCIISAGKRKSREDSIEGAPSNNDYACDNGGDKDEDDRMDGDNYLAHTTLTSEQNAMELRFRWHLPVSNYLDENFSQ